MRHRHSPGWPSGSFVDIRETLEHEVDLVIDGGYCGMEPTTVVDISEGVPLVTRQGKGDIAPFG